MVIQQWDLKASQLCLLHPYNQFQARVSRWVSKTGDGPLYLLIGLIYFAAMGFVVNNFYFKRLKPLR